MITGEPIAEMQRELEGMNLEPSRDGDRLFVNLGERKADDVTRALATKTKLASFAPEQATLERIYLHAASADAEQQESAAPTSEPSTPPVPHLGSTQKPRRRAYGSRVLLSSVDHRQPIAPLSLVARGALFIQ